MDCKDTGLRRVYELRVVRESMACEAPTYLNEAGDVYRMFVGRGDRLDREEFLVLLLDNKNRMLGYNVVSTGSLTAFVVHPREVFKAAVIRNTARMVLVHNHPSGDPTPSGALTIVLWSLVKSQRQTIVCLFSFPSDRVNA